MLVTDRLTDNEAQVLFESLQREIARLERRIEDRPANHEAAWKLWQARELLDALR